MWVLPLGPIPRRVRRCTRRESRIWVLGGSREPRGMRGGRSRVVVTLRMTRRPSRRTCTRETGRAHSQRTASIEAKSKPKVDIADASTARAELHLPRVGRDYSRPEQTHTFRIGVGTPGHVCRCTGFFSRRFLRRMGFQAAGPLRTCRWQSRLPQSMQTAPPQARVGGGCGAALMRAVGAPVTVCGGVVREPAHRACRHLGL